MNKPSIMEKVILALQQKQNALLESPTGTGKVSAREKYIGSIFFKYSYCICIRHCAYYVQHWGGEGKCNNLLGKM